MEEPEDDKYSVIGAELPQAARVAPVTLGYSQSDHGDPEVAVPGYLLSGRPG